VSVPLAVHYVRLAGALAPQGLAVDDSGRIFVTSGGSLEVFQPSGTLLETSPFEGKPAGTSLAVTRSFSDVDPASIPFADSLPPSAGN
jgi:hypothetical protein